MPSDHVFTILGIKVPWRYTRLKGTADGWAQIPDAKKPHLQRRVWINEALTGRARLETEIHEFLHQAFPGHAEEHIAPAAKDLMRILYRLGYRRVT